MDLLLHKASTLPLDRPLIMGILNLTPDSFSDGGQHNDPDQAVSHSLAMASQGADIIDVGGESTRPGARRITSDEQIERVVPVIRSLRLKLDERFPSVQISIDTTLTDVARAAVDAGASILNDVSAGLEDTEMLPLAAKGGLPIILMHMQGKPATMQNEPAYTDVVAEVRDFLLKRAQAALDAGVDRRQIVLDPGIGFGKTTEHNLELLRSLPDLVSLGYPIMIGASRKRFLSEFGTPQQTPVNGGADRLGGTCAVTAHCVLAGVKLLRVHDVAPNRQAANLAWAL
jgi:dihydropteroate synthase